MTQIHKNYEINVLKEENLFRELNVVFAAENLRKIFDSELDKVSSEAQLKGFRPGKVPRDFIMQEFGPRVYQEQISKLVNDSIGEVLDEEGIEFLQHCDKLEKLDHNNIEEIKIGIKGEKMPEFEFPALQDLEVDFIKLSEQEIVEKELQKEIQNWKDNQFIDSKKNHKIADGDRVTINFDGKIEDKSFEGGTGKDLKVIIGKNQLMSGLEPQILGMKVGEKKDCTFTMNESPKDKSLHGKEVKMNMEITKIEVKNSKMSDEDLIKALGHKDAAELQQKAQESLQNSAKNMLASLNRKSLFDKLDEILSFELPQIILKKELENLAKNSKKSTKENEKVAQRRVKLAIFLIKFARQNGISLDQQDVVNYIMKESYSNPQVMQQMVGLYQKDRNFQQMINNSIIEGKSADLVEKTVKRNERELGAIEIKELYEKMEKEE